MLHRFVGASSWAMENAKRPVRSATSTGNHTGSEFWKEAVVLQINRVVEAQHVIHREYGAIIEELEAASGKGEFTGTPRPAPAGMFRSDGVAFYNQQEADCHFLLIAIRNVLRVSAKLRGDQRVAQADQAFQAAFPHAKKLRDILEHLHDYEEGKGTLQTSGREMESDDRGIFIRFDADDPDGEIYYHFGIGIDVPLKAAAVAAVELADLLGAVEEEKAT